MADGKILRHAIGRSTLEEGFTVPRAFEDWMGAPEKGHKVTISLLFETGTIFATLRRLKNQPGHVQVKYEAASGALFREWMKRIFHQSQFQSCGEYIEIHKIEDEQFQVIAFPHAEGSAGLVIHDWLFHRGAGGHESGIALSEIQTIVQGVEYIDTQGQAYYNREFAQHFSNWAWDLERRVVPELGLKSDFVKEGTWVEVEFGNARTYYQDFLKFMLASRYGSAKLGVLVVPSESFAFHLCAVGRTRAEAKGRFSYGGMIHFEKVRREFKYIDFMITMPIAIASIGFSKQT